MVFYLRRKTKRSDLLRKCTLGEEKIITDQMHADNSFTQNMHSGKRTMSDCGRSKTTLN